MADGTLIARFDKRQKITTSVCAKMFIQVNMHIIFGEVISRQGVSPDPAKIMVLMDVLSPKTKK